MAGQAYQNLSGLRGLQSKQWAPLLMQGIPGALAGGGLAWLGHRLLAGKGETEEEQNRKKWQRRFLALGGGLLGAYGGANAAWKYSVAPEMRQGLARSFFNPERAFSEGLHKNYATNVVRGANAYGQSLPPVFRVANKVSDAFRIPGLGSSAAWLNTPGALAESFSMHDPTRKYRRGGAASVEASPGVGALSRLFNGLEYNRVADALRARDWDPESLSIMREELQRLRAGMESKAAPTN